MRTSRPSHLIIAGLTALSLWGGRIARAEGESQAATAAPPAAATGTASANARVRSLSVLPATDTSSLNLGPVLQNAEAALFQQAQYFTVQSVQYALTGFAETDVAKAFQAVSTELMSLVYLEGERITVFMFDSSRPKEFIVATQVLIDPMVGNSVTPQVVEYKLRLVFNDLLAQYYRGQYQPLPGAKGDPNASANAPDDPKQRAAESHRLFKELSDMETTKYYLGANMGMARYAGGPGSSSNVNFGAFTGMQVSPKINLEFGLDFFSYVLTHLDARYSIPLAEKYVSFNVSLGVGRILGVISGPRFPDEASISSGAMVFGPGFSFNVPLLGASVRGELKFYFGGGSIFMGGYGISYSI